MVMENAGVPGELMQQNISSGTVMDEGGYVLKFGCDHDSSTAPARTDSISGSDLMPSRMPSS
jgi:hypothetical protein